MTQEANRGFWTDFRRFFVRGLATLLPTILTIVLLVKGFEFVQQNISVHITEGAIRLVAWVTKDYPRLDQEEITEYVLEHKLPAEKLQDERVQRDIRLIKLRRQWSEGPYSLIGFVLAIILVYIAGRLLASYIGHRIWQSFEHTVQQVPMFKQVYPNIKQVTDFLFAEQKIRFSRVVAIQYPREGTWSIGLVTGGGFQCIDKKTGKDHLTVFVPTSPTPMTGYVVHLCKNEVIDLPITIEEALRFVISGGVIVPDHQAKPSEQLAVQKGPRVEISTIATPKAGTDAGEPKTNGEN